VNLEYYQKDNFYKPKFICFDCRKVFKHKLARDIGVDASVSDYTCPHCGKEAASIGSKFRAPNSGNVKAWESLKVMHDIGAFLNFSGWATVPINIPESRKALHILLTNRKQDYLESIAYYVRRDYDSRNKQVIGMLSEQIQKIDDHLKSR
jgi:predicted RNA-binding Zn-ribbon protein involved in translation (DUF1610 family)